MALNKESNGYVITFSIVMVVVVGALLATVAMALQPAQKANVQKEKMANVLQAAGMRDATMAEAEELFKKHVVKRVILDFHGNIKEGTELTVDDPIESGNENDAFNVDLLKEYKNEKDPKKRNYPLYVCEIDGETMYVAPVQGQGLWAAVWGYISLDADGKTIKGAVFDHKSETPGLGAEIANDAFEKSFIGKTIAEGEEFTSVSVIKPGPELDEHSVDGISGGTFTSVGVDEMISRTMVVYYNFLIENPNYK